MRSLPAGWPDPSELVQSPPKVYLHVADGVWPPASVQDGESLPAGWTLVGEWSIECDLDAPLLPGQVNSASNFTIATASCTIPQPEGGLSAPWRAGAERTPVAGHAELVASYDGYNGSTAFVLGKFLLDPIKGKLSEPWLSLTLVQDLVRLRKPHAFPTWLHTDGTTFSPSDILRYRVEANGFIYDETDEFPARLTSSYFPGKTDELTAMQKTVAANLGALYLSMDGSTVRVLDPEYLLGAGAVQDTLVVLDKLEDLSWSQDPNAAVDRVVVTYIPPSYDDDSDDGGGGGPDGIDGGEVWTAPKATRISSNSSEEFQFDPGAAIQVGKDRSGNFPIWVNTSKYGQNSWQFRTGDATEHSSGSWTAVIANDDPVGVFLVAPNNPGSAPSYSKGTRAWIPGVIDRSSDQTAKTLTWGAAELDATNALTFDLGKNIQRKTDARLILDRIVTRIASPTYVVDDVNVVPDVRRELADLYVLTMAETGFNTRAMVTGIKLSGSPAGMQQSLTIAAVPIRIEDFNAANPAVTFDTLEAAWAGKTWDEISAVLPNI